MNMSRQFLSFWLLSDNFLIATCASLQVYEGYNHHQSLLAQLLLCCYVIVPLTLTSYLVILCITPMARVFYQAVVSTCTYAYIVSVIAYYDEDMTTLTWISSLVSDATIARSTIVEVTISSIISGIVHNEYVKTRNDNDHE